MAATDIRAVVLTGEYGAGKSAMAAEICHQMSSRGVRTAAIDLDWLAWAGPGLSTEDILGVRQRNLTSMVGNFVDVGVQRFAMAGALRSRAHREVVEEALGTIPLVVVRLVIDSMQALARIRGRDVGSELSELIEDAPGVARVIDAAGVEDLAVANGDDRSLEDATLDVLAQIGWIEPSLDPPEAIS